MTDLDLQVKRLDVQDGDILVVRTRARLTGQQADLVHDQVLKLATRGGYRNVGILILDDCSDLTVEPTQMAQDGRSDPFPGSARPIGAMPALRAPTAR